MLLLNTTYGKINDYKTDNHSRNSTFQTFSILIRFFLFPPLIIHLKNKQKKTKKQQTQYFCHSFFLLKKYILIPLKQNTCMCASCEQKRGTRREDFLKTSHLLIFISYSSSFHSHTQLKTTAHPS